MYRGAACHAVPAVIQHKGVKITQDLPGTLQKSFGRSPARRDMSLLDHRCIQGHLEFLQDEHCAQ